MMHGQQNVEFPTAYVQVKLSLSTTKRHKVKEGIAPEILELGARLG